MEGEIKPLTGKELFTMYHEELSGVKPEIAEREWEENVGKARKAAYNAMADRINKRLET